MAEFMTDYDMCEIIAIDYEYKPRIQPLVNIFITNSVNVGLDTMNVSMRRVCYLPLSCTSN